MAFDDCEETTWDGIVLAKLDQGFYLIQDLTKHCERTGPRFVVSLDFMHENRWMFYPTIEELKTAAADIDKRHDRIVHLVKTDKPN
jgi:hypothetical protein